MSLNLYMPEELDHVLAKMKANHRRDMLLCIVKY